MDRKRFTFEVPWPNFRRVRLASWLPSRGNVLFTLVIAALLILAQSVGALPLGRPQAAPQAASTGTIAYQGRLANAAGEPLNGTYPMIFRLYTVATGGTPLWTEQWTGSNSVRVSDGLFNVMLGSLTQLPVSQFTNSQSLYLGITVGTDDEMQPRVQLGSVPFAVQALTVPDGSVTTAKIADGAVTTAKIVNGAITQEKAPSLLRSLNGNNQVILIGNQVYYGTDSNGFVTISYPCFPNGPSVFLVINGHWDANQIWPVGHNGPGRCSTQVKMSSPTSAPFRVNWIAIGY